MRLLLLTKRFSSGKDTILEDFGREIRLAEHLNHHVTILALDYKKKERKDVKLHGMHAKIVPFSAARLPAFFLEALSEAKKNDLILAMGDPFIGAIAYFLSAFCGKPFLYDIRDNYETYESMKLPGVRLFEGQARKKAAIVTAASYILAERSGRNAIVIPNGVDLDIFKPLSKAASRKSLGLDANAKIIAYLGSANNRGIEQLIDAFRSMRKKDKNLQLLLVGNFQGITGEGITALKPMPYKELPKAVCAADVLTVPYEKTPFTEVMYAPYKLVEFMACNRPIVCSDVGEMGKLVPVSKGPLEKAIKKALASGKVDYRKSLVEKGLTWKQLGQKLGAAIDFYMKTQCKAI
jgi:teichuronic acid biosynthesis glycosyltransferase TuaC